MTSSSLTLGRATMHMGDCLEVMACLPKVDAVITDPPYCSGSISEAGRMAAKGQGVRHESVAKFGWFVGDNMGTSGLVFLLRSVAFRALDLLSPSGSMLVFCDWRMLPSVAPAIESAGLRYQNLIVWDKGSAGLGNGFRHQHELILHFTAGAPKYFDLGTSNVIRAQRVAIDEREHHTQKPVSLLQRLVRVVTPSEGVVLDPFAGSGSTGVAALAEGRRFIGVERDREHYEVACQRLAQTQQQQVLAL